MLNIKDQITVLNQWTDRSGYEVEGIVIHSAWGFYNGTISWFKNAKSKASTHYVISEKGEISKCVEEKAAAWHAGVVTVQKEKAPKLIRERWGINPNLITIGVELIDQKNRKWKYPKDQYVACVELVADICKRYNIDPDRGVLIMHKEIDPINRTDPVGFWDQDKFIEDIKAVITPKAPDQPKHYDFAKEVDVLVTSSVGLNIRSRATTESVKLATLRKGSIKQCLGFCEGQEITGNDIWWKVNDGSFMWSGGTNKIPVKSQYLHKLIERR